MRTIPADGKSFSGWGVHFYWVFVGNAGNVSKSDPRTGYKIHRLSTGLPADPITNDWPRAGHFASAEQSRKNTSERAIKRMSYSTIQKQAPLSVCLLVFSLTTQLLFCTRYHRHCHWHRHPSKCRLKCSAQFRILDYKHMNCSCSVRYVHWETRSSIELWAAVMKKQSSPEAFRSVIKRINETTSKVRVESNNVRLFVHPLHSSVTSVL